MMNFDYKLQFDKDNKLKHFLNIENLSELHIKEIISKADEYEKSKKNKFYDLEGKTVASLFLNPAQEQKLLLS
jgi:aspartate carbamoyltransferase catalytic subunit